MEHLNLPSGIKIGTDIVFMPRMEKHLDDNMWLRKILTSQEIEVYHSLTLLKRKLEFLSGRYAAKEAYSKAKGVGIGTVSFHDFEVLQSANGRPVSNVGEVSISHDGQYAIAMVLIYE